MEIIGKKKLDNRDVRKTLASLIIGGAIFVYPTDTCYALGANSLLVEAVHSIYIIKKRDFSKPLPVIARDLSVMEKFSVINEKARAVFNAFPGISLVLPKRYIPDMVNPTKIMVRVPDDEIVRSMLEFISVPIISTSANSSGDDNPYMIGDVLSSLSSALSMIDFGIDAGKLETKKPSTILDCIEGKVYREGEYSADEVMEVYNAAH